MKYAQCPKCGNNDWNTEKDIQVYECNHCGYEMLYDEPDYWEESKMKGVCCYCQEVHEVEIVVEDFHQVEDVYVMKAHIPSFMDNYCDGRGSVPQALIEEEEENED